MRILVTGSNGLLGSALKKELGEGHIYHTRKDADLLDAVATEKFFEKNSDVDVIVNCCARVGGVGANISDNLGFLRDNLRMDANVIDCALKYNIQMVNILSTCIFPDKVNYPLTANQIDQGSPHLSNIGYSYAKRHLYYVTKFCKEVTGNNWISIIPTNLYGYNDNFNLKKAHLIPALIRKAYECSLSGEDFVVWGDGSPLRQFVFSEDMAKIILYAINSWNSEKPFMAVNPKEYSIKEISEIIANKFNIPCNRIVWDKNQPNGQLKKTASTDVSNVFKFISLEDGLDKTIDWFIKNIDNIRK